MCKAEAGDVDGRMRSFALVQGPSVEIVVRVTAPGGVVELIDESGRWLVMHVTTVWIQDDRAIEAPTLSLRNIGTGVVPFVENECYS